MLQLLHVGVHVVQPLPVRGGGRVQQADVQLPVVLGQGGVVVVRHQLTQRGEDVVRLREPVPRLCVEDAAVERLTPAPGGGGCLRLYKAKTRNNL